MILSPRACGGAAHRPQFLSVPDPGPPARLVSFRTPADSARRRGSPVPSRPLPGRPRWLRAGEEQRPAPPPRPPAKAGPWRVRSERGREPEPSQPEPRARATQVSGTRAAGACRRLLGSAGPPGGAEGTRGCPGRLRGCSSIAGSGVPAGQRQQRTSGRGGRAGGRLWAPSDQAQRRQLGRCWSDEGRGRSPPPRESGELKGDPGAGRSRSRLPAPLSAASWWPRPPRMVLDFFFLGYGY